MIEQGGTGDQFTDDDRERLKRHLEDLPPEFDPPPQTLSGELNDPFRMDVAIEHLRSAYRARPEAAQLQMVDQLWELLGRWSGSPRPPSS